MTENMIVTEDEAKTKICLVLVPSTRPMTTTPVCMGSQCMNYWRWIDASHAKGYCSRGGKPEFE